ncbi:MFS transporter [Jannaschia aquimarina]|uniref:Stp_1 protein n=1 Tax=Jannaschia aquimarina TaxID=935700 RepID=A0A0D1DAX1_9RHOB|nr:MFS transporter [Jannaschia aquimarina]KIT17088.1 Multidrug resistance protein stp [Jannaschia aquimarina]SNS46522.1 drug resistance transporter, EmrB/QacA subfamily [Jannaschia aquimarina]
MSNALPLPCQPADPGHADCPDTRGTLIATVIGSSLVFVLGSIVNVALPQMQDGFGTGPAGAQWIVNSYLLPLSALVLLGGALGDHYGRKAVFLAGLAVFAASCILCAIAWSFPVFLIGRVLEGVGAAMIAPTSLSILSGAFTGKARGAAIGTWAGAGAAAGALAPVAGGWIVDAAGWRWAFVAVLPFVAAAMVIGARSVKESRAERGERAPLDWTGAVLAALGLLAATWSLTSLPAQGATPATLGGLAGGLVLLGAFLWVEHRKGERAMTPLALFDDKAFSGLSVFTFLLYAALGGLMFLLPYVLIRGAGYSSTAAGAAILPFPLILGLLSRAVGGLLTEKLGTRLLLTAGAGLVAAGFALFGRVPSEGLSYAVHILPPLLLLAVGMAFAVAPLTAAVLDAAGEERSGVASGVNNAISRVGGLVATALLGLVLGGEALLSGFATAAWAGAVLAAAAGVVAFASLRPAPPP